MIKHSLAALSVLLLSACGATQSAVDAHGHQDATTYKDNPKYETYLSAGQNFALDGLVDITGKPVLMASDKRKLLIFFATWCHDSQRTTKQILASTLVQDDTVQIIGIGREENQASLAKFAKDYGVSYQLVADPERNLYSQVANTGVPRVILLDEQNTVVKTIIGEHPQTIDLISWQ